VSGVEWRWAEKDFGFRFRSGTGRKKGEYYQAADPGHYYMVPAGQRKLPKDRLDELAALGAVPASPTVVPMPWRNYHLDWDWIATNEGLPLNFAGCLDRDPINRREDEGVARAMEFVVGLLDRPVPAPLSAALLRQLHRELMANIYPFAGEWRTVDLHKGEGPTKWPCPPGGIHPLMEVLERDVFGRSPFFSENDDDVFGFVAEVMCELLALHPFREGNGRTVFTIGNLLLMQNDLLPLDVYDRKSDEARYFAACEAGRTQKDYLGLTELISEWEAAAMERWEASHGK